MQCTTYFVPCTLLTQQCNALYLCFHLYTFVCIFMYCTCTQLPTAGILSRPWTAQQCLCPPFGGLLSPFLVGYCPPFVGLLSHLWWVLSPFCWVPIPPLVGSVPLLVGCCPPFCGLLSPLVGSAPLLVGCCPIFGVLLCPLWWIAVPPLVGGWFATPPLVVGLLLPLISSPTNPPSSSGWQAFQQRKNVHEL